MAIYGLYLNYFPGDWYNEIKRGKTATISNIMFLVCYVILLIWVY